MSDAYLLLSSKAMIAGTGTLRLSLPPSLESKTISVELKDTGAGEFEGYAAIYGVVDEQKDEILPGAFAGSLSRKRKVTLLWQHDMNTVLGEGELEDSPRGLRIFGKLDLAVGRAREIYSLIRRGVVKGLSIGYTVTRADWKAGVRRLIEIALHEVSLTAFPAQPLALITAVKTQSSEEDDLSMISDLLRDMRLWWRNRSR